MKVSFLIVTRNRPVELAFTLKKLRDIIDLSIHEVLVFIDGDPKTEAIMVNFNWVNWTVNKQNIGASPARNALYKKAKGTILIGLDDDAHPISNNFIAEVENVFSESKTLGIIAFQEVRGCYESDTAALKNTVLRDSYLTNDFVGCGFAIRKEIYDATNGFPLWLDIYGEEPALALEILDLGYDILYKNSIVVNHRIDIEARKTLGRSYFRFEKQLQNTIRYYVVYYPNPFLKIAKLLFHNFKKYAVKDATYLKSFFKVCFSTLLQIHKLLKYRNPVKSRTIQRKISLKQLNY